MTIWLLCHAVKDFEKEVLEINGKLLKIRRRVKTPTVLQMEAGECGAAALGIVLGYYGSYVPLEELRISCGVSRGTCQVSNITEASHNYGLISQELHQEIEDLLNTPGPVILYWNYNHYVVLEGFGLNRVYLNDPAEGPRVIDYQELKKSFTGVALTFEPGPDFRKRGSKPGVISGLRKRLRGLEPALLYVVLMGLFLVIPGLVTPAYTRVFVDEILLSGKTDWLRPLLMGMLLTGGIRATMLWLRQHYLLQTENRLAINSSGKFFWHVLRLPAAFYQQRMAGEISHRIQLNSRVAQLATGRLAMAFLDMTNILFFLIVMLYYDVLMTLIVLALAAINLVFLHFVTRYRKDAHKRLLKERGMMAANSVVGLQNIETLKATGSDSDFFAKWAGCQAKLTAAEQKLGVSNFILGGVPALIMSLTAVIVLACGGYRILSGAMTIGMLVAFQSLTRIFLAPVNNLVNLGGELHELEGNMDRLDDVVSHPVARQLTIENTSGDLPEIPAKLSGYVELKGVTFGYSLMELPLIDNFNLKLSPGSRVALVGGSGSGKSTIGRLVAGLYEPWKGEILYDGQSRREIPWPILNSSLAVVDQEIYLLTGSIRENISLWNESIPEAQVIRAAKDALIDHVVTAKKNSYESEINEGGNNFSGGEKQRLEIARALAGNPTILVLDEATSALDPLTEKQIDENIRQRGCTCLIVAHRLSTIRDCDEIIVMEQGRVVQRGTHDTLKDIEGPYQELISTEG